MSSPCVLSGGGFQDSEGNVLALGYLEFQLSMDGSVSGTGNICSGITVKITLDADGNATSGQSIWGNDVIAPVNTFYRVIGYTAEGQPAWGPNNQQVTGTTFNLSTWIPNQIISWTPSLTSIVLETNGTQNTNQDLLNLESTDGSVTITNPSGGNVDLSAAGTSFGDSGYGGFFGAGRPMSDLYGPNSGASLITDNNNQVNVFQFVLQAEWTIRRVSAFVYQASSGPGTASFGIYSSSGAKLVDSGGLVWSSGTQGTWQSTVITPVTLLPGVYYFAQSASVAATFETLEWGLSSQTLDNMINAFGSVKIGQAANSVVGGVLPATLGTITADSTYVNMAAAFFGV